MFYGYEGYSRGYYLQKGPVFSPKFIQLELKQVSTAYKVYNSYQLNEMLVSFKVNFLAIAGSEKTGVM